MSDSRHPNDTINTEESVKSAITPEPAPSVSNTPPVRPSISRGGSYGPPQLSALTSPKTAPISLNLKEHDHVKDYQQHGLEFRNPYERLVAKLGVKESEGLPIIVMNAFGSKPPGSGLSPLLSNGLITQNDKTVQASLPYEFVVGAAQIAAELGGPNSIVTSRLTISSQDTMPSAPKFMGTKLKTGKEDGSPSGGVIPVDLSTTTVGGPNGTIVALKQNENDAPSPDEKQMPRMQWAKPLEQILSGMNKIPPQCSRLESCTDESIKQDGRLYFKVNCADSKDISNDIYCVDLCQKDRSNNPKDPVQPIKIKEMDVNQPTWWDEKKFGDFNSQVHCGYHLEYKKPSDAEFKPYEVYGRYDKDGNLLVITGDQDLFALPRSEKYDLKELGTEVVDTHSDAYDGVELLAKKLRAVNFEVLTQDLESKKITPDEFNERRQNFNEFIDSSHTYIETFGTITPYEAYFSIHLNNRIAQLRDAYKDNPEELRKLAEQVDVGLSMGMKNIKDLDIDIHPAWFKENPAEFSQRVDANLAKGFHVSPDILALQVEHLSNTNAATVSPSENSVRFEKIKENINEIAKEQKDWKIYARIEGPPPPLLPGDKPTAGPHYKMVEINEQNPISPDKIVDILIHTKNNSDGKNLLSITEKAITSSAKDNNGLDHIKDFEDKVGLSQRPSIRMS